MAKSRRYPQGKRNRKSRLLAGERKRQLSAIATKLRITNKSFEFRIKKVSLLQKNVNVLAGMTRKKLSMKEREGIKQKVIKSMNSLELLHRTYADIYSEIISQYEKLGLSGKERERVEATIKGIRKRFKIVKALKKKQKKQMGKFKYIFQ